METVLHVKIDRLGYSETLIKDSELNIRRGDRVWLQGLNGAGKTTLLKALAGLTPFKGFRNCSLRTLYLPERGIFFDFLNPKENIKFWRLSYPDQVNICAEFDSNRRLDQFSSGQRIFLQIYFFLHRRDVLLLLDDCLSYLDDTKLETLSVTARRLNGTLMFTSQDSRAEKLCTRALAIKERRIVEPA